MRPVRILIIIAAVAAVGIGIYLVSTMDSDPNAESTTSAMDSAEDSSEDTSGGLSVVQDLVDALGQGSSDPDAGSGWEGEGFSQAEPADMSEDVSVDEPLFDVVRVSASGETLVAGRAAKSAQITLVIDGKQVGSMNSDAQGRFVHLLKDPLLPGEYRLSLIAENRDGNLKKGREAIVILVPDKPVEVGDRAGRQQPLVILIPGDDSKVSALLQRQFPLDKAPVGPHFVVDAVEYNSATGNLTLTGEAFGDALTLIAYVDNQPLNLVRVRGQSTQPTRWRITGLPNTTPGERELRIDMVVANRVVFRRLLSYTHPPTSGFNLEREEVQIKRGDTLWELSRRLLGRGYRYIVIYEANREQISDPNLIYPGQVLKVPLSGGANPIRE